VAGTLAFSRYVISDILRNKSRTLSSIIGVVLAVSLIAGENIALDTTAKDVLANELNDYNYDLYGTNENYLTTSELDDIEDELESVYGVDDALPILDLGLRLEVHNSTTIVPPTYGFYEKEISINVPPNSSLWLNVSLDRIPSELYRIYGYVYSDYDGEPVENAYIEFREMQKINWDGGFYNNTFTDSNGFYETYLPESQFIIEISKDLETYISERINVSSNRQDHQFDYYIQDVESASVQGYVIDPLTGDPVNGTFYVGLWNYSILHYNSTTTSNGYYFLNTIPGEFTIRGTDYVEFITDYKQVVVQQNFSVWQNLSLAPDPVEDVQFSGFVYDNLSGHPLFDARISINNYDRPYGRGIETDILGYFETNIASGNTSVRVSKDGYKSQQIFFHVAPENVKEHIFYLDPLNSTVEGYVGSYGAPSAGRIYVEVEGTNIYDTTWSDSKYKINLPAGNHTLIFDGPADNYPIEVEDHFYHFYSFSGFQENLKILGDIAPYELIDGSINVEDNNVVVVDTIAHNYGLKVGDQINLVIRRVGTFKIWTFNVSGIVSWEYLDTFSQVLYPDFLISTSTQTAMISYMDDINSSYGIRSELFVKMDRDKIIDPLSKDAADLAMLKLTSRVNSISSLRYDLVVQSILDEPLENYYEWLERYRFELIAYSIPVIAVGFYLGIVGIDLATGQKRRTIGILKSRGANENQIFTSLLLEATVLGVIAGIIGLFLGFFVSRIFISIIPGSRNLASGSDFLSFNISLASIIWAMILAIILMLFASYKPAKRISQTPVVESLHQHSKATEDKKYKPHLDIFLVFFAVFAYIILAEINFNDLDPARIGLIVTILLIVAYLVSLIWLPISPIVLMFSSTRLLTRGTSKIYRFFSKVVKPFAGELWYLISKNMTRNSKRVSRVSIIIALAIGFGIFMTSMIGTTINGDELEKRAIIGSDLRITPFEENYTFEESLKTIQGVDEVILVCKVRGLVLGGDDYGIQRISLFNASEYQKHVEVMDHYFVEGSLKSALTMMSTENAIIVGDRIARTYSLSIGSIVQIEELRLDTESAGPFYKPVELKNNAFKVAGIVRAMPGLELTEFGDYFWGSGIYMDFHILESSFSELEYGWHFLVDVKDDVDSSEVENSISTNFSSSIIEIENLDTTLDGIRNDISSNSVIFIMLINIGFMIIIITVGLGLILFISINERKNELATMMARGAEGKHLSVLIIGEAFSITLVGAFVGLTTGLFTAYTFNKMLSSNSIFGSGGDMMSGRPLILPWYGILIVFLAFITLMITSILAAYKVKKIKLHQALRARGG
jgi:ABC-type lipoprotein release transport system permease subunit